MKIYTPLQAPNPEEWLSLDKSECINLVEVFHEEAGEEIPENAEELHAIIHVVVES